MADHLTPSILFFMGFPGGSDGKEYTCNVGDQGSIPGLGRSPGGGHGNTLQYFGLENAHGQRNMAGYSPWVRVPPCDFMNYSTPGCSVLNYLPELTQIQ